MSAFSLFAVLSVRWPRRYSLTCDIWPRDPMGCESGEISLYASFQPCTYILLPNVKQEGRKWKYDSFRLCDAQLLICFVTCSVAHSAEEVSEKGGVVDGFDMNQSRCP